MYLFDFSLTSSATMRRKSRDATGLSTEYQRNESQIWVLYLGNRETNDNKGLEVDEPEISASFMI